MSIAVDLSNKRRVPELYKLWYIENFGMSPHFTFVEKQEAGDYTFSNVNPNFVAWLKANYPTLILREF